MDLIAAVVLFLTIVWLGGATRSGMATSQRFLYVLARSEATDIG
jgi:hypothetical protein